MPKTTNTPPEVADQMTNDELHARGRKDKGAYAELVARAMLAFAEQNGLGFYADVDRFDRPVIVFENADEAGGER